MIQTLTKVTPSGGSETAVLSPLEINSVFNNLNDTYKIRANFLLQTAMRISEAYNFVKHPEYFEKDHGAIFIPKNTKYFCDSGKRAIMLSPNGIKSVEEFLNSGVGLAAYQNMEQAIKLAGYKSGFDTKIITTKMLRKTMISWLMMVYPEKEAQICHFAGHNIQIMRDYYLTFGWRKEDVKDMRMFLEGWGEA